MRVLVTGSEGFLGKNVILRLKELNIDYDNFTRKNSKNELRSLIEQSDFIIHLAGENRPENNNQFELVNYGLTSSICDAIRSLEKNVPIIFASSSQAELDNPYGKSKLKAEAVIKSLKSDTGINTFIFRLPGVFGKWCKPNYNSVVATFCNNISKGNAIQINDPKAQLRLVYIDDVVDAFIKVLKGEVSEDYKCKIEPEYKVSLGDLADLIRRFKMSRNSLISERVGIGFERKLYSTYMSYLSPENFSYSIPTYGDERGIFAEVVKTKDSGQFSFFTAKPGITRGGHYHHSKTEKFLVIKGKAKFRFKHLITKETHILETNSQHMQVVETVPGWIHDITNIGDEEMLVMLWANEVFNPKLPDTFAVHL